MITNQDRIQSLTFELNFMIAGGSNTSSNIFTNFQCEIISELLIIFRMIAKYLKIYH